MTDEKDKRDAAGRWLPGGTSGRRKGARNKLHGDFVCAVQQHFDEIGKAAIDIVFKESPRDYLKIIVAILPKEFVLEDGRLESMSDDEISEYLEEVRYVKKHIEENRSLKPAGIGEDRGGLISGKKQAIN